MGRIFVNPKRYQEEIDYYDRILEKYKQMLFHEGNSVETRQFVYQELISLMDEINTETASQKERMSHIAQNIMILLLSLFEKRDMTTDYKDFADLDESEKSILRKELIPIFQSTLTPDM
jgi:hypothetical protein